MAPFQILGSGSNVDVRSSGGYNGAGGHRRAAKTTSFVPSTPTPSSPASSFAGATMKSRATSSWRRQRRTEAAVNDATWQLVKKLVTLTVPLCESRLVKTPFWPGLLFRGFFVSPRGVNAGGACHATTCQPSPGDFAQLIVHRLSGTLSTAVPPPETLLL